jgi:CRP/FNR family cyclic AMP-dependent transcriptional regulator
MHLNQGKRASKAKLDLLRKLPALAGCSDKELAEVARQVDDWSVTAGTTLTKEGEIGREAFLIVDGRADVVIRGEKVAELGPGEFIGEMSMVDHQPRTATVVAQTPMMLLPSAPASSMTSRHGASWRGSSPRS